MAIFLNQQQQQEQTVSDVFLLFLEAIVKTKSGEEEKKTQEENIERVCSAKHRDIIIIEVYRIVCIVHHASHSLYIAHLVQYALHLPIYIYMNFFWRCEWAIETTTISTSD